jgi:uncharacterized membrane protein YhaH (DUF805 family)
LRAKANVRLKREPGLYDWQFHLTWKGRIGPRTYVIGSQVLSMAAFFAALLPIGVSLIWEELRTASLFLPVIFLLLAAITLPGSSLLVRRAHDLGWPAAFALTISVLPLGFLVALVANIGRGASGAPSVTTPAVIAAFLLNGFLYFWLALKKGQPTENRYGAPPV